MTFYSVLGLETFLTEIAAVLSCLRVSYQVLLQVAFGLEAFLTEIATVLSCLRVSYQVLLQFLTCLESL